MAVPDRWGRRRKRVPVGGGRGGGGRPPVEAKADDRRFKVEAGDRGLRRRWATASGSDGEDGTIGLRRREKHGNLPGMRQRGCCAHFAAAVAAAAGGGTVRSPSSFCASGEGWGSCWSWS
jgi:hypothetical protein